MDRFLEIEMLNDWVSEKEAICFAVMAFAPGSKCLSDKVALWLPFHYRALGLHFHLNIQYLNAVMNSAQGLKCDVVSESQKLLVWREIVNLFFFFFK